MVEAELLVEGQVVLDRDGCDVYLALARQLADTCFGGGRASSMSTRFSAVLLACLGYCMCGGRAGLRLGCLGFSGF
ncbi:MAG: hypothetical protein JO352_07490 [Chloroflexi bacterium]|nr:hypothetical protein [Chloroflexota bacterium]